MVWNFEGFYDEGGWETGKFLEGLDEGEVLRGLFWKIWGYWSG